MLSVPSASKAARLGDVAADLRFMNQRRIEAGIPDCAAVAAAGEYEVTFTAVINGSARRCCVNRFEAARSLPYVLTT